MINRGLVMAAMGVAMAAGAASAGVEGSSITVRVGDEGFNNTWFETEVVGDFVDNNTFVAMLDLSGVTYGDVTLGSENFIEYRIEGDNLRSGGGMQTVTLNFNVLAGFVNTSFAIDATPLAAAFATATGTASAGLSVTESSNPFSAPGATLSPDGAGIYEANYNASSSIFANLFTSAVSVAGGGGSASFTDSAAGPIAGSIADIGASWHFTLTSFDLAAGTSTFTVTPTPGTLALLGFGGLLGARRRR